MRYRLSGQKKGQILIFVLFLFFLVGFIGTALAVIWQSEVQQRKFEHDSMSALYLAQAGLEHAKIFTTYEDSGFRGWKPCDDDSDPACWYYISGAGRYKFRVYGNIKIIGIGQAYDTSEQKILAERQIEDEIPHDDEWAER